MTGKTACDHKEVTITGGLYAMETRYEPAEYWERIFCAECGAELDRQQLPEDVKINDERKA